MHFIKDLQRKYAVSAKNFASESEFTSAFTLGLLPVICLKNKMK